MNSRAVEDPRYIWQYHRTLAEKTCYCLQELLVFSGRMSGYPSEGCNPGKGIALEWVGTSGTGMGSEGTPHKDGSERERHFLDRRRSFRTRGRVGRGPQGLHPGLVCVAPLGRVSHFCLTQRRQDAKI